MDDLDTPDEADVLDYTDHELDWEGETQSTNVSLQIIIMQQRFVPQLLVNFRISRQKYWSPYLSSFYMALLLISATHI